MDEGDPRTGDEAVIHIPTDPPGSSFAAEVVIPDPGVPTPTFYAICQQDAPFTTFIGSSQTYPLGQGGVDPSPVPGEGIEPVATGSPALLVGAGLGVVLLIGAAAAWRSVRRTRRTRDTTHHAACVARQTAATTGAAAARVHLEASSLDARAELARAVNELRAEIDEAKDAFEGLLGEPEIVAQLIDDTIHQIVRQPR